MLVFRKRSWNWLQITTRDIKEWCTLCALEPSRIFLIIKGCTVTASQLEGVTVFFHQAFLCRSGGLKLISREMLHYAHTDTVAQHVGGRPQTISNNKHKGCCEVSVTGPLPHTHKFILHKSKCNWKYSLPRIDMWMHMQQYWQRIFRLFL